MEDKKKNMMDLSSIVGGGMKNLINSVDNMDEVTSPEKATVDAKTFKEGSFVIEKKDLDDNINYYLRVKKNRKTVYLDVDSLRKLGQIQLGYKYNNDVAQHIPVGTLVSAILKTFFDANGIE